jgi:ABC-type multidrug transport system ATPase subunit
MVISLSELGKKFINQWIFRELNVRVEQGAPLAVTGPNGSGKSTLLKIISGWMLPSEGQVSYQQDGKLIEPSEFYKHLDYVAPYVEIVEELSLSEFVEFHFTYKSLQPTLSHHDFLERIYLENEKNKILKFFSSGMKQRLKLGLGFFSRSPVLLLDEPTTNLDDKAKAWYFDHIGKQVPDKLIIIASNEKEDYSFANEVISMSDYTYV